MDLFEMYFLYLQRASLITYIYIYLFIYIHVGPVAQSV